MTSVADACLKHRNKWRCLAAVLLASLSLFLLLTGATGYSTTKLELAQGDADSSIAQNMAAAKSTANHTATAASDGSQAPVASTSAFAPFLDIIPSQDGTALFISAGRTGELPGTVFANIGIGPGHDKDSYTMVYSGTAQAYVTTAMGFSPRMDDYATINITTTSGLDTGIVEFNRDYVQASTSRSIFSRDGNLELRLVSTDTITFDTYVAVVPSYAPPGPAPLGHRFVGSAYSVRAAGALVTTDKPMSLRLAYNATTLAGADPHTLVIFAWDAFNERWDNLGGRLFYEQQYLSVAMSRFTTYALMSTPAWRDDFDDFSGLNLAETSNVTLGLREGYVELLVLSYMATSGTAVSKPITPTAVITSWGTLTFTRTVDPPTTTLTVDVLSLDGTEVLTDVASGASLAGIDPEQYPSLKLRANLSSTVAGETPALDEWQVTWQPKACYDVNDDDEVDIGDIQDVANHWRGLLPYDVRYDIVLDGIINILDVMTVAAHWGEHCGSTYIKVVDESSNPLASAIVYADGQFLGVTNQAGLLDPGSLGVGTRLVSLAQQAEQSTARAAHDAWAYRTHLTNLTWDADGNARSFVVNDPGEQRLVVRRENPLVLFNLVVSVEWDATYEYLDQIARAVRFASDYVYDIADGQMVFGQVAIYDNGAYWDDADVQIYARNIVRPYAYVGGITSEDPSHVIRVGRYWDGNSGNQGRWDEPSGYRTLIHQFGHYALYLYDEYFAYVFDENDNIIGEVPAYCTGPENRNSATDATNASVMDYHYTTSELSARGVPGLWSPLCEATAHWQLTERQLGQGESAWETLVRMYTDTVNPPRWQFITPADRGSVLAGPEDVPSVLPDWPPVEVHQSGQSPPPRQLTVYGPQGPYWGATVSLHEQDGQVIEQGFTDTYGQLDVYGAVEGDTLQAASLDGELAGSATVGTETSLTLTLEPVEG